MESKVIHKWINKDGRTIVLPPWYEGQSGFNNLGLPDDIRDISETQLYPIGTKMIDSDRVFYYAKASSVGVTSADVGVKNGYRQCVAYANVAAAAAKGATSLVIDVAATDGVAEDGAIAENELAGGYVVIFGHDDDTHVCRIRANTAVDSGGGEMTLTLQDEINATLVADSDHAECMHHWAYGCETNASSLEPVVGVSHTIVTASYYFWLQTWGPVWLAPQAEVGDAAHDHQVVFRHDGSIDEHDYSDEYTTKQQHAGFCLSHARAGGQAAVFIMLQICP